MSDDVCPVCSLPWPDFCPLDGSKVQGPGACRNAPQADDVAPEPAAPPKPAAKRKPEAPPKPAMKRRPAAKPKQGRADREPVGGSKRAATAAMGGGNLQRTAELSQIPGDPPEAPAPKPRSGSRKAKRPTRKLKRRGTEPAVSQAAPAAPAPQAAPADELADTEPAPSRASLEGASQDAAAAPVRAPEAPAERSKARRRKGGEDLKKTVIEMSAVEAAPLRPAPRKKRGGAAKHLAPRPRTRSDDIAREAEEAQRAKEAKAGRRGAKHRDSVFSRIAKAMRGDAKSKAGPTAPVRPARRKRGFSETQWFLQGVKEDGDILEVKSSDEVYEYDESVSEEERRKFTLRREDEE